MIVANAIEDESAQATREALGFAMALVGIPAQDRDTWLDTQTRQRESEALALGASPDQANAWAAAWRDFVRLLIGFCGG